MIDFYSVLSSGALLAPMAGVTDAPFRRMCMSFHAAGSLSEMVSAKALTLGDRVSLDLARRGGTPGPYGVQIFASDPATAATAVKILYEAGEEVGADWFDLNCGCPAPKIVSSGCGSALMKTPKLIGEIVKAMAEASPLPVTVKLRAGWDADSVTAVEAALFARDAGAAAVTVHGRTRDRMYAPPVDTDIIARVNRAADLPVIANGDIFAPGDVSAMLDRTGCAGVMIGRGALGRPFFFENAARELAGLSPLPEPGPAEKMRLMLEHMRLLAEWDGEARAMLKARKHAAWYTKGIRGAAAFRREMNLISTFSQLEDFARRVAESAEE